VASSALNNEKYFQSGIKSSEITSVVLPNINPPHAKQNQSNSITSTAKKKNPSKKLVYQL
jgi:hypothetical protein